MINFFNYLIVPVLSCLVYELMLKQPINDMITNMKPKECEVRGTELSYNGPGVCPWCNSDGQLTYEPMYVDGPWLYYDFTCDNCGIEGTEYYDAVYSSTSHTKRGE